MSTKRKPVQVDGAAPPAKKRVHRKNGDSSSHAFGSVLSALVSSAAQPVAAPVPVKTSSQKSTPETTNNSKSSVTFQEADSTGKELLSRSSEKMKQERVARREVVRQSRLKKNMTEAEQNIEMMRQRRLEKEKKLERKLILDKDHVRAEFNDLEKRLIRIATKGVVTLFNAVSKQQKELAAAADMQSSVMQKDRVMEEVSQQGFLELLKESGKKASKIATKSLDDEDLSSSDSENDKSAKKPAGSSWKALDEDYMLGGSASKLKNWEASDSSDESGDGDDSDD